MDTFLGRALTDPATGLPNIPYFCLIQDWEERRARRRDTHVRVLRVEVQTGSDVLRRAFTAWLCQELRTSDLVASDGRNAYRILLTSPDAERADAVVERVRNVIAKLNDGHNDNETSLGVHTYIENSTDDQLREQNEQKI
jgi:GGDEF domain-containing protein